MATNTISKPSTDQEWIQHSEKITGILKRYGSSKIIQHHYKIKGPISPGKRKERVLEFWRTGDTVPRNPFLHRSLWHKAYVPMAYGPPSSEDNGGELDGYAQNGDNGRIFTDLVEHDT